jgi:hypothetical protein
MRPWMVRLSALRLPSFSGDWLRGLACWHSSGAAASRERVSLTGAIMSKRKKRGRRGFTNKRLAPDKREAHREAAFAAIRRLYAELLPLWSFCRRGYCRRHKQCGGKDVWPCLQRCWPLMPPEVQTWAYREVIAGGPRRVPPASRVEWDLRRYPPSNFVY